MHAEVEFWNNCFDKRSEGKKLARNQAADELSTRAEALDLLRAYDELWKPETFIEHKLKRTFSEYNSQNAEAIVRAYDSNSDSDEMLDALASPQQEERVLQAQRFVLEERDRRRRLLYGYESESERYETDEPRLVRPAVGTKVSKQGDARDPHISPRQTEELGDEKFRPSRGRRRLHGVAG